MVGYSFYDNYHNYDWASIQTLEAYRETLEAYRAVIPLSEPPQSRWDNLLNTICERFDNMFRLNSVRRATIQLDNNYFGKGVDL